MQWWWQQRTDAVGDVGDVSGKEPARALLVHLGAWSHSVDSNENQATVGGVWGECEERDALSIYTKQAS